MGSDPFCVCVCVTIDAMLKFDSDIDTNANSDVKCEHTLTFFTVSWEKTVQSLKIHFKKGQGISEQYSFFLKRIG